MVALLAWAGLQLDDPTRVMHALGIITIGGEIYELTYNHKLPNHHLVFEATAQSISSSKDIKVTIKFSKNLSEKLGSTTKLDNHFDWYMTIKDLSEACLEYNVKVQT